MAAPRFNLNATKNGTRLARLTIGELPAQLLSVKRECRAYRRGMEEEVTRVYGEVSVTNAHLIDTATQALMHVGICRWILRNRWEKMDPNDIMACSKEMLRAKETRDKAVHALALHREPDFLDALYSDPQNEESEESDEDD